MRNIVHVWQSASDEEIALPGFGENGFILFRHVSSRSKDVMLSMVSGLWCPQGSQGKTGVGRNSGLVGGESQSSVRERKISTFKHPKFFCPAKADDSWNLSKKPLH